MTGDLQFNDANGVALDVVRFDDEVVIKAYGTLIGTIWEEYNPYDAPNVKLRNAKVSDLTAVSHPEGMYFTDGVLLGSLVISKYCRKAEHRGKGPCDFIAHPIQ